MMDMVLTLLIASCMTLTQFALQLKENVSSCAYIKNLSLVLDSVTSIHAVLENCKKFKNWGSTTDSAKKAFQKLEDLLRKCTGLLQRCISARSKLLQMVSENSVKVDDFVNMHAELEACLLAIPTEAMADDLVEQIQSTCQQLHDAAFEDVMTAEMKQQFQQLMQEGGGGAAGVRRSSSLGTAYTQSQHPAGQMADLLGFDGSATFRKEQEALALEKRKAAEGRDKAQEQLLDQLLTLLTRMEKELPTFKDAQAKLSRERTAAAASASRGGLSVAQSVPKSPKELASPTRRRMMLLANAVDDMTDGASSMTLTGSGGSGRDRKSVV